MSVREVVMYRVVCDWPGCEASAQDATDYYAWADLATAVDVAVDAGWWPGYGDDQLHYCYAHPHTWATDGEPLPEAPYLLLDEDGTATLVGAAS